MLVWADQIEPCDPKWAWYPYLPQGMISLLAGRGGDCKGLICASLAAAYTRGAPLPDGEAGQLGKVLWCEAEDPLNEVVIPRVIAAGAERTMLSFPDKGFSIRKLGALIKEHDLRLVVLSPFLSYLSVKNIRDEIEVRTALDKIQDAIKGTNCALLGICHFNKNVDLGAVERLLGSVAFVNFVRSVLLVARDKDDSSCVRMMHAKHNLSVQGRDMLVCSTEMPGHSRSQYVRIDWERADENKDPNAMVGRDVEKGPKLSAADWLESTLRSMGESSREMVISWGKKAGYSESALDKAIDRDTRFASRHEGFPRKAHWSLA